MRGWFAEWHEHIDWDGWGNLTWQLRKAHLELAARAFEVLAQDLDAFPKPYQLWIQIDGEDSSDDGVFIHSPSPHEPFPKSFEDVTWGEAELAAFFDGLLPGRHMAAGSTQREERTIYFVYAREVGESLADQGGT